MPERDYAEVGAVTAFKNHPSPGNVKLPGEKGSALPSMLVSESLECSCFALGGDGIWLKADNAESPFLVAKSGSGTSAFSLRRRNNECLCNTFIHQCLRVINAVGRRGQHKQDISVLRVVSGRECI